VVAGRQPAQPQFLIDLRAGTVDQDEADAEAVQQREVPKQPVHVVARTDLTGNHHDERSSVVGMNVWRGRPQRRDEVFPGGHAALGTGVVGGGGHAPKRSHGQVGSIS
jgi:hypothetical protein